MLVSLALGQSLFARDAVAPPPASPIHVRSLEQQNGNLAVPLVGTPQLYSIGQPSNQAQLYLEYINRARANPTAEGMRIIALPDYDVLNSIQSFGVNLALFTAQMAAVALAPPLAFNAKLIAAAEAHTQDMFTHIFQSHTGSDGSGPDGRMTAQGYSLGNWAENIYCYSRSTLYGHVSFEIDWGGTPENGGMQVPPGHRNDDHNPLFREIGVSVIDGTNYSVGPQLVTEDFASQTTPLPFVTGVVYQDTNQNGFYDPGEGLGGVRVDVTNANFYAVTSSSGGYAVPVPANGTYSVTFSGGGVASTTLSATVANLANVKLDYVPSATAGPTLLANISTRLRVGTGNNVLIGGFIVTGTTSETILVRAIGPSLPVSGRLANPFLELHDSTGATLESNDDWGLSPNRQAIMDSTIPPTDPLESALVRTVAPGAYTAIVRGVNDGLGVALVEIYDLAHSSTSRLANISTRGQVLTGDNVMIGGIILLGSTSQRVLVRAIGPSLGVPGSLANPTLELRDANGALLAGNDNWRSTQEADIIATTIPPPNDLESAIVTTLAPASYTAIVRGVNNGTGVALVEVYALH
jgi:hypothetical protein